MSYQVIFTTDWNVYQKIRETKAQTLFSQRYGMKNILLKRENIFYENTIIVPVLKKSIIEFRGSHGSA